MGKVTCGDCKKSCKGQAVRLQDKYFHVKCFKCKECRKQLAAGGFYTKDDKFYCAEDYQRLFGTKCADCGKFVEGEVVTALGNTYHQSCFHCTKCGNKFAAGDKVTYTGQDYMCTKCLEKYEKQMDSPSKKKSATLPAKMPADEEKIVPEKGSRQHATLVTSTPARTDQKSPTSDGSQISESGVYHHNGALSPISLSSDESFSPRPYSNSTGNMCDELSFLGHHDDDPSQKERLSPVQQLESQGSYDRRNEYEYGRFYNTSYLKPTPKAYIRGPSMNPSDHPASPHYHRPANFSYTQVRRDFVKPMKKESSSMLSALGDAETIQNRKRSEPVQPPMNNEEAIKLMRNGHQRGRSKERIADKPDEKGDQDPRIQKNIDELNKIGDSGVGRGIMRGLERKRDTSPTLDPRSASRTPSAKVEPPYKTRYESPVFASPRPGYGLGNKGKSATLPASTGRARSFDPYDVYETDNKENGEPEMESRSHHTSRSSMDREDEVDPETGLRKSRWRSSATFNSNSYMRRSLPSMLKGEGPPPIYPYEQLLLGNPQLPAGVEKNTLEMHLSKDEFESIFHMRRDEFYRIAEWKRNDMKKRVGLF